MRLNYQNTKDTGNMDRRNAIKTAATLGAMAALPKFSWAEGKQSRLKVGLIGCSGRGMGAVRDMLAAANGSVQITSIADLFPDRLEVALNSFKRNAKTFGADCFDVPASRQFAGWDAYKQLLAEDVDIVIHATPPVFRPLHLRAAAEAGKHMFVEKPACVDPVQARELEEVAKLADEKNLSIIPGVQRRFHKGYQEAIKRVHDGDIGEILAAQVYWLNSRFWIQNGGKLYLQNPDPMQMEYQIRNWFIFRWISGDCYVEQHVHNLDILRWVMDKDPLVVNGVGGRRWDLSYPNLGDRFSHFAVDYDFGNGVHASSYSRREPKSKDYVHERIVGTKGILEMDYGKQRIIGKKAWESPKDIPQCLEEEHRVLIESVQNNKPVNMLRAMLDSTLMAIAGRESCYAGQDFKFAWLKNRSKQSFTPKEWKLGVHDLDPIPLPGEYKLS